MRALSRAGDDALALTVLAAVLDGYSGARLDRALTQGQSGWPTTPGPTVACGAAGRSCSRWVPRRHRAKPRPRWKQRCAAVRWNACAREGVTEAELNRVKTQWVAGEVYKLDSVFNQARELGSQSVQGLPLDAGERLIERLRPRQAHGSAGRGSAFLVMTSSPWPCCGHSRWTRTARRARRGRLAPLNCTGPVA